MGVLQQLKLLFKKNYLIRKRQPGILALEVLWPIFIVIIVTIIRQGVPPNEKETCHFQERAMPSAGVVPFLQTFVCNLENECRSKEELEVAKDVTYRVSALVSDMVPYIGSKDTVDALNSMDKGVKMIKTLNKMMSNNTFLTEMDKALQLKNLFRDPDKVKDILMKDYGFSNPDTIDALLNSTLNITSMLDLLGYTDLKNIVCTPDKLKSYLLFKDSVNITDVSRDLCNIDTDKIPEISLLLQKHIDIAEIVRLLGLFEKFKETIEGSYTVSQGFNDIADMFDLIMSSPSVMKAIESMSSIKDLTGILRKVPEWIKMFEGTDAGLEPIKELVAMLDPIIKQLKPNCPIWESIKSGVTMVDNMVQMVEGKYNGTSDDLVNIVNKFLNNLEMAMKGISNDGQMIIEAIADLNIGDIFNQAVNGILQDKKITDSLNEFQETLEKTSLWNVTAPTVSLMNKMMKLVNITLHQTLGLEYAMLHILGKEGSLSTSLSQLIAKGPNVTHAVLDAFTDSKVIAKIFENSFSYLSICTGVIDTVQSELGDDTANQLRPILCNADAAAAFQKFLETFEIDKIQKIINETVNVIQDMVRENTITYDEDSALSMLYFTTRDMIQTAMRFGEVTKQTWGELFSQFKSNGVDLNKREWYPVLEMMNTNYVGTSIIAMGRALGQTMYKEPLVEPMSQVVHMAKLVMEYTYSQMKMTTDMYGSESPMGKLMKYGSQYAPELAVAVMSMMDESTMYELIESEDPFQTVCSNNWMDKMVMPAYVPMSDIETVVCDTDWNTVVSNIEGLNPEQNELMKQMETTIQYWDRPGMKYNMSYDWITLMDYTERTADMIANPDTLNSFMGMTNVIKDMNMTKMMKAVDIIGDKMMNTTTSDIAGFLDVGVLAMVQIDRMFPENDTASSVWNDMKRYVKIATGFFKMMNKIYGKGQQNLQDMLKYYPTEVSDLVQKFAAMIPETILALRDTILNPEIILARQSKLGFKAPDCHSVFLSDYMIDKEGKVRQFENYLCQYKWSRLGDTVYDQSAPEVAEFSSLIGDLFSGTLSTKVNWTEVARESNKFVENMEAQIEMIDIDSILPFNITAMDMSWSQFVQGMKQLENVDGVRLSQLMVQIQNLMLRLGNDVEGHNNTAGVDSLTVMLYSQQYITNVVTKFAVHQLEHFDASKDIYILDYLGSDELKKLFFAIQHSPDFTQMALNFIDNAIINPKAFNDIMKPEVQEKLLTDVEVFKRVFNLDHIKTPPEKLMKTFSDLNINMTKLYDELNENWPGYREMVKELMVPFSPNVTKDDVKVNETEFLINNEKLGQLIATLVNKNPNFVVWNNTDFMELSVYEEQWNRFTSTLNQTMEKYSDPRNMIELELNIMSSLYTEPEMRYWFNTVVNYLDVILDINTNLSKVSIKDEFAGSPNMIKLMDAIQYGPEALEVLLYTSLMNNEKLTEFITTVSSGYNICADPTKYFIVPEELKFNLTKFFDLMCSVNYTVLEMEAENLPMFQNMGQTRITDFKPLTNKLVSVFENVDKTATVGINLRLFNNSLIESMIHRAEIYLNRSSQAIMSPAYILKSIGQIYTGSTPELRQSLSWIPTTMAVLDTIMDRVLAVENMTSFSPEDMFREAPEFLKLYRLIQKPGVFEVLLNSVNSPKFQPLLMSQNSTQTLMLVCDPRTDMNQYLVTTAGVNVNMLRTEFCKTDFPLLINELEKVFNVKWITNVLEDKVQLDYEKLGKKYERMVELITQWVETPPTIQIPKEWENGSYWLDMLERYNANRMSPEAIDLELRNFMESIRPLLNNTGFEKFGLVIDSLMQIVNRNLIGLENKTLTLSNMLYTVPILRDVMDAMGINSDILETILKAPVKNPQLILETFLQNDTRKIYCGDTSAWYAILNLPPSFDASPLNNAVCKNNNKDLIQNLIRNLNIEELVNNFDNATYNMEKTLELSQNLGKNIESFMKFMPDFKDPDAIDRLIESYNETNLWNMLTVYSTIAQLTSGMGNEANIVGQTTSIVYEFLNNLMSKFDIKGHTLDLGSIFKGSPTFMRILKTLMNLTPDPINGLLGIQLRGSKNTDFANIVTDPVKLNELFCSEEKFREYFLLADTFNVTVIVNGMCNLNFTLIVSELGNDLGIDTLIQQLTNLYENPQGSSFDIKNYIDEYRKFSEVLSKFFEIKDVTFEGRDLGKIFDVNGTVLEANLMKLLQENGLDYTRVPTEFINSLLSMSNDTDLRLADNIFYIFNQYLKLMNRNLEYVKGKPFSLALLVNQTQVGPILMTVLLEPEWLEDIALISFNPEKVLELFSNGSKEKLCGSEFWEAFILPDNDTGILRKLQDRICQANLTVMEYESMTLQIHGFQFIEQLKVIMRETINGNKAMLNTTELEYDIKKMVNLLTEIINGYLDGKTTVDPNNIVDIKGFQETLKKFEGALGQKVANISMQWASQLQGFAQAGGEDIYDVNARTVNSMNLFFNIINDKLEAIKDGEISTAVLLNNTEPLINVVDAVINIILDGAVSLTQGPVNYHRLSMVLANMTALDEKCNSGNLATYLNNDTSPQIIHKNLETIFCSMKTLPMSLNHVIDVNYIIKELTDLWNMSIPVKMDINGYTQNLNRFNKLITHLAQTKFTVDNKLQQAFTPDKMVQFLENIFTNPSFIFRVLEGFSPEIEKLLKESDTTMNVLSQISNILVRPAVRMLTKLEERGITLGGLLSDPNQLLSAVEYLTEYETQASLSLPALAIQLSMVTNNKKMVDDLLCNKTKLLAFMDGLDTKNFDQLQDIMCKYPAGDWSRKFDEIGQPLDILMDLQLMLTQSYYDDYFCEEIPVITKYYNYTNYECIVPNMTDKSFTVLKLMRNIEKLTNTFIDAQAGSTKWSSPESSVQLIGKILQNMLVKTPVYGAIHYLKSLDLTNTNIGNRDFPVVKKFFRFFTSAESWLNDILEKFTDAPEPVKLGDILPDSEQVAATLTSILGEASAAEFVTLVVNPEKFLELAYVDDWIDMACNISAFNETFTLKYITNIDVKGIQESLCEAATNSSNSIQKLVDLFDASTMLQKLEEFLHTVARNTTNMQNKKDPELWKLLQTGTKRLLDNIDKLENITVDPDSAAAWFKPLLNLISTFNNPSLENTNKMCKKLISFFDKTQDYQMYVKSAIVQTVSYMRISIQQVNFFNTLDDITCEIVDDFNITTTIKHMQKLFTFITPQMDYNADVNCNDIMSTVKDMYHIINTTITNTPDFHRMGQCLSNIGEKRFGDFLTSVDSIFDISTDILQFIRQPGNLAAMQNLSPDLQPVLEYVINIINLQKQAVVTLGEVLKNSTSVADYLTNSLKIAPYITEALLKSTINLDTARLLNESVEDIQKTLCNSTKLATFIQLPVFAEVNFKELSDYLCLNGGQDVAIGIKSAADFGRITKQLLSLVGTGVDQQWLNNLTDHTVTFIDEIQSLSGVISLLGGGLDLNNIQKDIGTIDRFLLDSGPDRLVRSLTAIIDDMKYVVQNNESREIIGEINMLIKGFMGLDLIQSRIIKAIKVTDLLKNPLEVETYMINELGLTEEMARTVLGGTYSLRVFLNATIMLTQSDFGCETLFNDVIILNTTRVEMSDITKVICQLNKTQAITLTEQLLPELDIGDMIKMYVTTSASELLKAANMTAAEAKDMTQKLTKAQVGLQKASAMLKDNNDTMKQEILDQLMNSPQAQTGSDLTSVESILCGKKSEELVKDAFSVQSVLNVGEIELKEKELQSLPTEFCRDIYRDIMKNPIGSIIWAYLKPILRGKILYTPDNELTRQIVAGANDMFDTLVEVRNVAKAWFAGSPGIKSLMQEAQNMDELKEALKKDFVKDLVQSTAGVNVDELLKGLAALESDQIDMEQLNGLQTAAGLLLNYTECVELSRYVGVDSELDLERESRTLMEDNNLLAGIVFTNLETPTNRQKRSATLDLPKHVQYKIRMDIDNTISTHRIKRRTWKPGPNADFADALRYQRGFIQLQDMIENAIIRLQTDSNMTTTSPDPGVYLQQFPYPCYVEDDYIHYLGSYLLPVLMTFAWLAALGIATRNLCYDRENGQEETLRIMGMKSGLSWIAWFFSTMILMMIVCIFMALILHYGTVFRYTNILIIFLYLVAFCFSSTMLCYFVSAFFTRTTLAILTVLIIYFLSYLPYIVLISMEVHMTFWQKTIACLSCTTAFSFGAQFLATLEEIGVGIHWHNINMSLAEGEDMTFHWSCIMMLIDSAIYFVLGWYIRNIKSGKYGVSKPWYFIFCPSYWCCQFSKKDSSKYLFNEPTQKLNVLNEEAPDNLPVGISTRNLRKVYNKTVAVDSLNLTLYENQVTALLGHNGAAKTTTMNMITGVLEPTSGNVDIYGDYPGQLSGLLGICPQHNSIFDFMTVMEHMEFYAGVKSGNSSTEEIRELLKDVDLWHVRNVQGKNLSGGMQRRLCVALAFVGQSRAIVLDEPTSGVDPYARKNIWNLILKHKLGRTVLVSTHHLDEADMIGDRVAILHTGKLLCSGSPVFLKSFIGGGLSLTLEKQLPSPSSSKDVTENPCSTSTVQDFINQYHPNAVLSEDIGTEIEFKLPKDSITTSWQEFFTSLDLNKKQLKIASYGVSDATLEDVFLKVTTIIDRGDELNSITMKEDLQKRTRSNSKDSDSTSDSSSVSSSIGFLPMEIEDAHLVNIKAGKSKCKSGCGLSLNQLGAFLLKRFHHYRRDWRMIISVLVLPVILLLAAVGFSRIRPEKFNLPSLLMTPTLYGPNSFMFYKDDTLSPITDRITRSMMNAPGVGTTCMKNFQSSDYTCLPENRLTNKFMSSNDTIPICTCSNSQHICNEKSSDLTPGQLKMISDDYLQKLNGYDLEGYLLDSFSDFIEKRYGGWSFETTNGESMVKVWFNNKGYHSMPSFRNAYSNMLLRSKLTESQRAEYGISVYNHPLPSKLQPLSSDVLEQNAADAGIAVIILMAFCFIPSGLILVSIGERLNNEKHIQTISGVGPFFYWLATFAWDFLVYMISVVFAVIVICIFQPEAYYLRQNLAGFTALLVLFGFAILPMMYSTLKLFKTGSAAYLVLFCINMFLGLITVVTLLCLFLFNHLPKVKMTVDILQYAFLIFPQYGLCQGLIDLSTNYFKYKVFIRYGDDVYVSPFSFDVLGWNLIALAIQGVVFFFITVLIEYKPETSDRMNREMLGDYNKEEDVQYEAVRISQGQNQEDIFVVNKLSKVFRRGLSKFLAVDNISFGVHHGECFGLLGVNGAGKTTSFRMLTGELTPSLGSATLHGEQLCGNGNSRNKDILKNIGYCPQYGGLDEYLTAEELLLFYARVKGYTGSNATSMVQELINKLKLNSYAKKAIKTYSGGNKRKVSLAIAMIGEPDILFLDEPTTGMDPGTRRLAWKTINHATRQGQSVVLTSHSMDECDHLCSRLAIMVNGQLKCLGSPQHLKNKFGDGYIVRISICPGLSVEKIAIIQGFVDQFPGTIIKEETSEVIQLDIPRESSCVADIFSMLERLQTQKNILEYSLSQTSLDEVFVNFAKEQSDHIQDEESSSQGSSQASKSPRGDYAKYISMDTTKFAHMNPTYDGFGFKGVEEIKAMDDDLVFEDNWIKTKM